MVIEFEFKHYLVMAQKIDDEVRVTVIDEDGVEEFDNQILLEAEQEATRRFNDENTDNFFSSIKFD